MRMLFPSASTGGLVIDCAWTPVSSSRSDETHRSATRVAIITARLELLRGAGVCVDGRGEKASVLHSLPSSLSLSLSLPPCVSCARGRGVCLDVVSRPVLGGGRSVFV